MALVINDRVKETSTTTGTGTFDLAGAVSGFESFVTGIGNSNTTYYSIVNENGEFEVGLGTVTDADPDTLSRDTIISSSNSDAAVNFGAGTKNVFCTLPASKAVILDSSGNIVANNGSNLTNLNADNLSSGTVPDARFPATLPAADGSNLTTLNATELTSGTVPDARFPATLPAISGANLTNLDADDLASGTLPDARFPATLPTANGSNLTALNATNIASGTLASDRLPTVPTTKGGTGLTSIGTANQVLAVNGAGTALEYQTISADITGVTAGNGLTGGGTSGDVTLNVGAGTGIDVGADSISVDVSDFMTNGASDRIVTATGTDGMTAETDLTFTPSFRLKCALGTGLNSNIIQLSHSTAANRGIGLVLSRNTDFVNTAAIGVLEADELSMLSVQGMNFFTGGGATSGDAYASTILRSRIDVDGHFVPGANNTYNLGASGNVWANVYAGTISGNLNADDLTSGTVPIARIDLNLLTTSTADADGDFFVVVDSVGAEKKLTKANINISGFNNDSGFTTNTGTVTSVSGGNGLTGSVTTSGSLAVGAGTGIDVAADSISVDVSDFMSNGSNNRVLTATGTDAMNAEANLTFDGSTLNINGNIDDVSDIYLEDQIIHDGDTDTYMQFHAENQWRVVTGGTEMLECNDTDVKITNGNLIPSAGESQDLGSAGAPWRNIYTGDLHLSNKGHSEGNSVDGTKGDWTIQEGAEDLYILNNKSGKKYKFKLEEM